MTTLHLQVCSFRPKFFAQYKVAIYDVKIGLIHFISRHILNNYLIKIIHFNHHFTCLSLKHHHLQIIRSKLYEALNSPNYFHRTCVELRFITPKNQRKYLCAVNCSFLTREEPQLPGCPSVTLFSARELQTCSYMYQSYMNLHGNESEQILRP